MAEVYKGPDRRRSMCAMHTETIREIFEKIGKMVPIWVFLATIGIVGGVFSYITYLTHMTAEKAEVSVKATADKAANTAKEISDTVNVIRSNQAVVLYRLDDISRDIEELKQQHKETTYNGSKGGKR